MSKFISQNEKQTEQIGFDFAVGLLKLDRKNAVIAFFGGMGMGKTAFMRGFARGIGYDDEVTSPTFAIVNEYVGGKVPIYHFDMYRIETYDDLYSCGFFDYLDAGIFAIEWSENISEALPEDSIKITINRGQNDTEREIIIDDFTKQ